MTPRMSIIVLTLNEEQNIQPCLRSLATQSRTDFETIVIDAASDDATVALAEAAADWLPLRVHADSRRLPIGEARNLGVAMADTPLVAFLSADAELDAGWVAEAMRSLQRHDMVFGRQLHVPHAWTAAAAARGLRYHFPAGPTDDPLRYASNVAAAYHKEVLQRFPFDAWSNAAEDLLLAQRAAAAGASATYNPRMVVLHHDVTTAREEMRKNVREGRGCATYRTELGVSRPWLLWAVGLGAAGYLAMRRPWMGLAAAAGVLWAPALRRAMHNETDMPTWPLLKGIAVSPVYDMAFLVKYLHGLTEEAAPAMEVAA